MNGALLRAIYRWDRLCFALFAARLGQRLAADPTASPNLRFASLRIEPGGRLEVGAGFAAERASGNHIWVQSEGLVTLGPRVWLRTECGENRITAAEKAQ